jgi:hypothetical protein
LAGSLLGWRSYGRSPVAAQAVHASFTILCEACRLHREADPMLGIALVCFIGLFAFGHDFLGWADPHGQVQLGLFMSFLFGIVCGYRTSRD